VCMSRTRILQRAAVEVHPLHRPRARLPQHFAAKARAARAVHHVGIAHEFGRQAIALYMQRQQPPVERRVSGQQERIQPL